VGFDPPAVELDEPARDRQSDSESPPARGRGPDCVSSRSTGWGPDMRKKSDTYVLHVFQKKAKHGIATSKRDLNLIRTRLEQATRLHAENEGA